MKRPKILAKVIEVVRNNLQVKAGDKVVEETNFVRDLHVDSLDMADVVMALEDAFQIQITDDAAKTVNTVGDATDTIKKILDKEQ